MQVCRMDKAVKLRLEMELHVVTTRFGFTREVIVFRLRIVDRRRRGPLLVALCRLPWTAQAQPQLSRSPASGSRG